MNLIYESGWCLTITFVDCSKDLTRHIEVCYSETVYSPLIEHYLLPHSSPIVNAGRTWSVALDSI